MKYMAAFTVAALLAMLPTQSHAKNCKNSQPCGNSCISWSKTCRVGASAPRPAPAYRPPPAQPAPPSNRARPLTGGSSRTVSTPAATFAPGSATSVWVGLKANMLLYRSDCPFIKDFSSEQRVYFDRVSAANAAGFEQAADFGCPQQH